MSESETEEPESLELYHNSCSCGNDRFSIHESSAQHKKRTHQINCNGDTEIEQGEFTQSDLEAAYDDPEAARRSWEMFVEKEDAQQ